MSKLYWPNYENAFKEYIFQKNKIYLLSAFVDWSMQTRKKWLMFLR